MQPNILSTIQSPGDVKNVAEKDLPQLAQEIRDELIRVLSERNPTSVGGHLGPNLGVVELTHRAPSRLRYAEGQICL
jgi:1-deoxy-D-xylulose-5-phosphate synthase